MLPLRYDFIHFGGSWAQRQVFSFTMIQAAVRANNIPIALALVTELKVSINKLLKINKLELELSRAHHQVYVILLLNFCVANYLQAQKPKSKRLKMLFDELKANYDSTH
jgi:hypothetical protein